MPDFEEMEDAELKAFYVERRERQARHAAACEQIRTLQDEVKSIKEEIRTRMHHGVSLELKRTLDKTERRLSTAEELEFQLRDMQKMPHSKAPEQQASR